MNTEELVNSRRIRDLNQMIMLVGKHLEGNILYFCTPPEELFTLESKLRTGDDIENVRNNLFSLASSSSNIIQIGFNGGHSCALMFDANPTCNIVSFDLFNHSYTEPCSNYLSFNQRLKLKLIKGNTLDTLEKYETDIKFDLIHFDGGQQEEVIENDLEKCMKFSDEKTFLVIDDTNIFTFQLVIQKYLQDNKIVEVDYEKEGLKETPLHRIFHYVF